jgi:hypothetical protein
MSQVFAQRSTPSRSFEKKSDRTFLIILAVAFAVVGGLFAADWVSKASNPTVASKPAASAQAKTSTADPVYKCADGRVSFKPCG